jgi:hypothetical protein
MSTEIQAAPAVEQKPNDKEFNFRQLEAKYSKELEKERAYRAELEQKIQVFTQHTQPANEEDDDSEPYVDNKKLNKKLTNFEKKLEEKIDKRAEEKARMLFENEKKSSWLESNSDFYDVLQHAEKFAQNNPILAETILKMPDGFERQKLVYANIKALGLHKPVTKESSIQEKVDANRRGPFYQPTGIANTPYSNVADFSEQGKKQAYEKMQEMKSRLRLG